MRAVIFALLTLAAVCFSDFALAADHMNGREAGFFAGGGLFRAGDSITVQSTTSNFGGWGGEMRGGVDLPWSEKFGTTFSARFRYADLENNGTNFTEDGTLSSIGVQGEFYFGVVALGGGMAKDWLKVHTISTSQGAINGTYAGTRPFVSASANYNIKGVMRVGVGGDYSFGNLGAYKSSGWTLGLSLVILL